MALKLNIRPELEEEIDRLLPEAKVRSKTEYINRAIELFNQQLKRELEISKLKAYFPSYQKEAQAVLRDFSRLKPSSD